MKPPCSTSPTDLPDTLSAAGVTAILAAGGIVSPEAEARIFIEEITCRRYSGHDPDAPLMLPETALLRLRNWLDRRLASEPLQYILGKAWFRDLEVAVTPAVLIPRPETEILVDHALKLLPENGSVLDLGTGSGAIALAIATERQDAAVTAVDISDAALAVARQNGEKNAPGRVEFIRSDLFSALNGRKFDLICANLPYVTEAEYPALDPEVRCHEPVTALVAPDSGMRLIFLAIDALPEFLLPGGSAIFELSPPQAPAAALRAERHGFTAEILRDLTGRDRFVLVRRQR